MRYSFQVGKKSHYYKDLKGACYLSKAKRTREPAILER